MKTKTIKCHFKNSRGNKLDARLDIPADINIEQITNFIVFSHCFTCSKETITTFRLSRLLAAHGYGALRFDFTGLGNSEGEFSSSTFSTTQDDLDSAIKFLSKNYCPPSFLMGHSLGGTTAISIAQNYNFIKGVVTVASPSEPEHVLHHFGYALTLLEQGITASFEVAGQHFDIAPGFVDDARNVDMKLCLSKLMKPVLVINIENDALVKESDSLQIQDWVSGEVALINVVGSDHLLSNREATEFVVGGIVDWIREL